MADVASAIEDWSVTASSNSPADATTVGAGLADNFQQIQATVRTAFAHKGADIASATTTDIGAVVGAYHDITGTTTITGLGTVSAGIRKVLQFDGALTFTYNATSLILPGNVDITTAAGDHCEVMSLGGGNWVCLWYTKDATLIGPPFSDATAIISGSADATKLVRIEADGITTATTRVLTVPDGDITLNDAITNLTEDTSPDLGADFLKTFDTDASAEKKVLLHRLGNTVVTAVDATNGGANDQTAIAFTSIPSWVRQIVISFEAVSLDAGVSALVELGDSGGYEDTSYVSTITDITTATPSTANTTDGFYTKASPDASFLMTGHMTLTNIRSNVWICSGVFSEDGTTRTSYVAGYKSLSGTLDRLQVTTAAGTANFDSGYIGISYT